MFRLGYNTNGLAHHRVLDALRLLADLLNSPGLTSGVFMALLEGRKLLPDVDGTQAGTVSYTIEPLPVLG